jgi:hypothetical protein
MLYFVFEGFCEQVIFTLAIERIGYKEYIKRAL